VWLRTHRRPRISRLWTPSPRVAALPLVAALVPGARPWQSEAAAAAEVLLLWRMVGLAALGPTRPQHLERPRHLEPAADGRVVQITGTV
jgi:hypothetical protein